MEIHGANDYLIDKFLRTISNKRIDEYGGAQENRLRFLKEVVLAITDEIGAKKTVSHLLLYHRPRNEISHDPWHQSTSGNFFTAKNVVYIHLSEADWDDVPEITQSSGRNHAINFLGLLSDR